MVRTFFYLLIFFMFLFYFDLTGSTDRFGEEIKVNENEEKEKRRERNE